MATWLYRIGEAAARRAWAVILIWVFIIAGVASAYTTFHGKPSSSPMSSPSVSRVLTAAPAKLFSPRATVQPSPRSRSKHSPSH